MRVLVDIPEAKLKQLSRIGARKKQSRAAVVREAIDAYLATKGEDAVEAFGLWGDRKTDGLKYQRKLRREW